MNMKPKELKNWALENNADLGSTSFYQGINENGICEERPDSEFGDCDIDSTYTGQCGYCTMLIDGQAVELLVGEHLIGGALGRAAGAF